MSLNTCNHGCWIIYLTWNVMTNWQERMNISWIWSMLWKFIHSLMFANFELSQRIKDITPIFYQGKLTLTKRENYLYLIIYIWNHLIPWTFFHTPYYNMYTYYIIYMQYIIARDDEHTGLVSEKQED